MGGSFNPPTIAHLKLMTAALDALRIERGLFVPSSHTYVSIKMKRAKRPEEVLSQDLRLQMLSAMAADDPRLGVDDLEFHRKQRAYTYETMESLQEKYPGARLYFLAGGDKVDIFPRWHRIREFLERFHIVVTKRDAYDPAVAIEENPFLRQYRDKFHIIDASDGLDGISSSALRDHLRDGTEGAEAMCHPEVWQLLQKNGGMYTPRIPCFRNEYRFLSNFWDAPICYRGLSYQNAEAAFQAQKCMTEAEKEVFTTLRSNEAKRLGRRVPLRPDWEDVKRDIMEEIVRAKFSQNEDLAAQLLATGDILLEEGNAWGDIFWGVDAKTRRGENHLGKILMKVRDELRAAQK